LLNWVSQNFFRRGQGSNDQKVSLNSLTGTTLEVYRFLVTHGEPSGPREVMRTLGLSGPSVSSFHLQKLERLGFITKDEMTGMYTVSHVYLKHFVLFHSHLIPRYMFYAMLSTLSIFGWLTVFRLSGGIELGLDSQAGAYALIYGISISVLFSVIFWRETFIVMKKERI
jgi:hypothetical protein